MGISTKSTYAVRAMFELAFSYGTKPLSVACISRKESISVPYLEQLLSKLRRQGLVKSVRGSMGGYILAKDPKEITVGEIVRILDGNITPVHCRGDKAAGKRCKMVNKCVTKTVWQDLRCAVDGVLDSVTLKNLCDNARK